ncbi:hypothetical protein EDD91_7491 [Streptomyces sp. KS 21]|nr:hypothetical protein EDD91_7491 [Streptomyces sp. KS 21]
MPASAAFLSSSAFVRDISEVTGRAAGGGALLGFGLLPARASLVVLPSRVHRIRPARQAPGASSEPRGRLRGRRGTAAPRHSGSTLCRGGWVEPQKGHAGPPGASYKTDLPELFGDAALPLNEKSKMDGSVTSNHFSKPILIFNLAMPFLTMPSPSPDPLPASSADTTTAEPAGDACAEMGTATAITVVTAKVPRTVVTRRAFMIDLTAQPKESHVSLLHPRGAPTQRRRPPAARPGPAPTPRSAVCGLRSAVCGLRSAVCASIGSTGGRSTIPEPPSRLPLFRVGRTGPMRPGTAVSSSVRGARRGRQARSGVRLRHGTECAAGSLPLLLAALLAASGCVTVHPAPARPGGASSAAVPADHKPPGAPLPVQSGTGPALPLSRLPDSPPAPPAGAATEAGRAPGPDRPASGIRHAASGIRHPASGIRHPASGIRHPASGKHLPMATRPGRRPAGRPLRSRRPTEAIQSVSQVSRACGVGERCDHLPSWDVGTSSHNRRTTAGPHQAKECPGKRVRTRSNRGDGGIGSPESGGAPRTSGEAVSQVVPAPGTYAYS